MSAWAGACLVVAFLGLALFAWSLATPGVQWWATAVGPCGLGFGASQVYLELRR